VTEPDDQQQPTPLTDDQRILREQMTFLADRVRTPLLADNVFVRADDPFLWDEDGRLTRPLTAQEEADGEVMRGALMLAGHQVMDWLFDDLAHFNFAYDLSVGPAALDESFIHQAFPERFRRAYDDHFARNVVATACKVVAELGNPNGGHAACIADEIVTYLIIKRSYQLMELAGFDDPEELDLEGYLLEDLDFETLFWDQMDGLEDDAATQASLGMYVPSVADWFSPFNDDRYPHPYAATDRAPSRANTLPNPHSDEEAADQRDPEIVDAHRPITPGGLAPGSEVVGLARDEARRDGISDLWIPNEADPEASVTALQQAMTRVHGSGYLTWEPAVDSDLTRVEGTVAGTAHRHFPNPDVPFISVSMGHVFLSIPLSAVVSWQPDPTVRANWNSAFSNPTGGTATLDDD
jgi:hypothetical protein